MTWVVRVVQALFGGKGLHRVVLRQKHLPRQRIEEMGSFQPVHHRAFHFRQVHLHFHHPQAMVDRLQAFQCAEIDLVDGRAHHHHVSDRAIGGDAIGDVILQKTSVGEVEALVDADGEKGRVGEDGVASDIAEMLGAWNKANLCNMWTRGSVEM